MMRSLFSGVAGLKNHQTRMDVIGNNIANVNTTGFKASRVNFQDILSQTMQGASSAQGNRGGTNPMQVGLGMGVASIDTLFTDGSYQTTGKQTDLSITGQGFFIVTDGTNKYYTRAGNFDFDAQGNYLVPGTGLKVAGWMADADGVINSSSDIGSIQIPVGDTMAAKATTSYDFINNLSDDAEVGTIVQASTIVYDSKGNGHSVDTNFIKVADNKWIYSVDVPDALATPAPENLLGEITFGTDGQNPQVMQIDSTTPGDVDINVTTLDNTSKSEHSVSSLVWDDKNVPHIYTTTFTNSGTDKWSYNVVEAGTTKSLGKGTIEYDSTGPTYTTDPASRRHIYCHYDGERCSFYAKRWC
ncbi:MAG: flgE 2 [Firmicutes bacterium]|nr:flgE 2 [Bacillota bacterium]